MTTNSQGEREKIRHNKFEKFGRFDQSIRNKHDGEFDGSSAETQQTSLQSENKVTAKYKMQGEKEEVVLEIEDQPNDKWFEEKKLR